MNIQRIALSALAASIACAAHARDGDYVTSFGDQGREQIAFSPSLNLALGFTSFIDLAVQPDGKLVVSGTVRNTIAASPSTDFGVLRLHPNGTLDTNFGTQGQTLLPFDLGGTNDDVASGVLLQPNGRIVLCGQAAGDPNGGGSDFAVARLQASGAPDPQLSADGKATVAFDLGATGSRDDMAVRCVLQADGKIVAAGRAIVDAATQRMAVVRLSPDGSRDLSFNGTGTATIDFGPTLPAALALDVNVLPDGRIVLIGLASPGGSVGAWVFARLDADGQLDASFGNGGILVFDPGVLGYHAYEGVDATVLDDGSLIAVGAMALLPDMTNLDYGVFKLTANGSLDTGFGDGGGKVIPFDLGGNFADTPFEVVEDGQGRLLVAGSSAITANQFAATLVRLTPQGQLDASFGVAGKLVLSSTVPPAEDFGEQATTVGVAPDGSVYVGSLAKHDAAANYHIGLMKLVGDTIFADGLEAE